MRKIDMRKSKILRKLKKLQMDFFGCTFSFFTVVYFWCFLVVNAVLILDQEGKK